jgi:predicted  nucleic acid-binding Zn-ribbon protein
MPSAKQILKQLQAEVDEATDCLANEVLEYPNINPAITALSNDLREKRARLDKAKGA